MFHISKGAIGEAAKSDYLFRHGAISFLKGKPQGKGYNNNKIHGGLARDYNYAGEHAEVSALKNVSKADTILVVRISRESGNLTMSSPCSRCRKYLKDKGIKKIIYSDWSGQLQTERL